jgi:hypothetical protein
MGLIAAITSANSSTTPTTITLQARANFNLSQSIIVVFTATGHSRDPHRIHFHLKALLAI